MLSQLTSYSQAASTMPATEALSSEAMGVLSE